MHRHKKCPGAVAPGQCMELLGDDDQHLEGALVHVVLEGHHANAGFLAFHGHGGGQAFPGLLSPLDLGSLGGSLEGSLAVPVGIDGQLSLVALLHDQQIVAGEVCALQLGVLVGADDSSQSLLSHGSLLQRSQGILQNLTIVPDEDGGYLVLIGNRRMEAAKLAGLDALPCAVVEMDETDQIAMMLTENMHRTDLTLYEQAQGMQMMMDLGLSEGQISDMTGVEVFTSLEKL